jgi:hypothetical protein
MSEAARKHILKMLIDHDCSWNDMMGLLQLAQQAQQAKAPPPPSSPPGERVTALELYQTIRAIYEQHITFEPNDYGWRSSIPFSHAAYLRGPAA